MKKKIASFVFLLVGYHGVFAANDNTSDQIQLLNSQIQSQLQTMQSDQQKQIQALNKQVQTQLKQMQTDLQAQIQKANSQTQAQIKQLQTSLQDIAKTIPAPK